VGYLQCRGGKNDPIRGALCEGICGVDDDGQAREPQHEVHGGEDRHGPNHAVAAGAAALQRGHLIRSNTHFSRVSMCKGVEFYTDENVAKS
jgi:hypothetical protein